MHQLPEFLPFNCTGDALAIGLGGITCSRVSVSFFANDSVDAASSLNLD